MAYRSEIERKLDEMISLQEWLKFQDLAVILAQQKWPQLVASEPNWDAGLDGHASGCLAANGEGIGLACSLTATLGKIESDAAKVVANYRDVRALIFATPETVTKHTEGLWAAEILAKFGLELVVVPRAQFIAWLQEPANSNICKEQFGIEPAMASQLAPALRRSLEAASEVTANWDRLYRKPDRPVISLNAVRLNEKGEAIDAVTTASIQFILCEGHRVVFEAPAGSGKTTTLVQVALQALAAGRLAFLVDVPEWVRSGKDFLSYVAARPQFASREVDATLLAKLRGDQPPIFLLNGWNEVPVASAEAADEALRELDRSFPAAIVIVATRKHSVVPQLRSSFRMELSPLTRSQRDEYLLLAVGESAHDLSVKLNNNRMLDSITRTPLFLAEVVDLYRSGKDIPATKMGVLGAVIDAIERSPEHQTSLRQGPLRGHAADYLRSLSMEMTERGETAIAEADGQAIVSAVSERFSAAKRISEIPEAGDILDELTKRHVLVRAENGEISFRFQHQQFQEFFAAGALRARLADLVRSPDPKEERKFQVHYVNEPRWGESLRLLAEDIGAFPKEKLAVEVGAKLVRMALDVDPILAAELARWCGPSVWSEVREDVGHRLREWYHVPDGRHKQCALAAMLATGSDDFKDIVVPRLTDANDQVRLAIYHSVAEFVPSSLGPRWIEVVQGWADDARFDFVLQLAHDPWSADTVEELALADPSPQIKWNVARQLSWYGFTEKVEKLLGQLDDGDLRAALRSLDPDEVPSPLRQRAIEVTEATYVEIGDAFERLKTLRLLKKLGAEKIVERMKAELDGLDKKQLEAGNSGAIKWALDELRESDSEWVSEWLARKILEGSTRFGGWNEMISQIPPGERDSLLQRFTNELLDANEQRRVLSILAASADAGLAARIFERACEIRRGLTTGPGQDMAKWNLLRQQQDLLGAIAPKILLEGLSPKLEADAEATELDLLTDLLGRSSSTGTDAKTALPDEMRPRLRAYLKRAVECAADPNGMKAGVRAHLAVLLGQVGGPSDIPDLRRLIKADSIRYLEMQAARVKGDRSGDNVGYVVLYMNAVMSADPDHGDEVLLEMLNEQQYEQFVAEELVRRASKSQGQPTLGISHPAYDKVWAAREGEESEQFVEERRRRYADALRARLEKILTEREATAEKRRAESRLKPIGTSLAALDAQRSAKLILEVMCFPAGYDAYNRVASLESLIFAGIRMTLGEMMNVLGPAIEQARRDLGNSGQNRWLLGRCLSVLPFVDPPEEGISMIREILSQVRFFYPHDSRGLVVALGASRCANAMGLLLELAKDDGSAVAQIGDEWITAVAQLGGNRSNEVLLSFVDPYQKLFTKEFVPDYHHGQVLAALLARRAEQDSEFKAELFRLANDNLPPRKRTLLAEAFSYFRREEDLVAGLCVLRDDTLEVPFELLRSIENVFLERRPYGTDSNVYTLAARSSNSLRKHLLEMAQSDPVRKRSAFALLGQIELWRLEHGRPADEPRHPDIESGARWPI